MFGMYRNELADFYLTPLGRLCQNALRRVARQHWPHAKGETLAALGYALPLLPLYHKTADVIVPLMPSALGAVPWHQLTTLSEADCLPLRDHSVNRVIALHWLEHCPSHDAALAEIHRILVPSGRALLIIPHRASLWMRAEATPFGQGHPFSIAQISALLQQHDLRILRISEALFFPPKLGDTPSKWQRSLQSFYKTLERIGRRYLPLFGGVLVIEVEKQTPAQMRPNANATQPMHERMTAPSLR